METVTQVLVSLRLNLCSPLSVYRNQARLNQHLPRCGMFISVALHTVTRRHINTDAHANTNTNTHFLCVSLSGQIRKHDIIFLVCLCTNACPLTRARLCPHTRVCATRMLVPYCICLDDLFFFVDARCFYKYRADILGCVITAVQQHTASLLVFQQWPSSSPLSALCVCVLVCERLFCCPVCTAESYSTLTALMLLLCGLSV